MYGPPTPVQMIATSLGAIAAFDTGSDVAEDIDASDTPVPIAAVPCFVAVLTAPPAFET